MSIAAFRWNYDDRNGGYPLDFYKACGLEDVVDKFPKEILKVGEIIGPVSREAALAIIHSNRMRRSGYDGLFPG